MTMTTLIKGTFNCGGSLSFRGSVHYRHGGKQAEMILRVLPLASEQQKVVDTEWCLEHGRPQSPGPQ